MTIAENIKRFRLGKNMSQTELGSKVGVTYRMIQKYESLGNTKSSVVPSISMIKKIAQALEVKIADIIDDDSFVNSTPTLQDYYNKVSKTLSETNAFVKLERDLEDHVFYFIFDGIYCDYHMRDHTGMSSDEFLAAHPDFLVQMREEITSSIIGVVLTTIVEMKLGKNKPIKKRKPVATEETE